MVASRSRLTQGSTPDPTPTNTSDLFVGGDGHLKRIDEAGVVHDYDATSALNTVADTDSVNLTLSLGQLSADVRLSGGTLDVDASGIKVASGGISNSEISPTAAISYSKLNLVNSIDNADISSMAGIVYSKLNLSNSISNSDVSSTAGITYSKLALSNGIVDGDINSSAAIS